MQTNFIFIAEGRGNSALRELCAGVGDFAFDQNQNASGWCKFDGCAQSGDSGADDQKISLRWCGWH
jgi:hypothetical protein